MRSRILVADDHQIFREGLRALLEKAGHMVVAEARDGREALRLAKTCTNDTAVLDISMPLLNGLDTARELRQLDGRIKTILLTMHADRGQVVRALRAGAKGYVIKTQAADDLLNAIETVRSGQTYISPVIAETVVQACLGLVDFARSDPLSPREREVLQLVAEGRSSKEIARILSISTKTAESHRYSIMSKLDIHDVAGLVRYAIGQGMLHVETSIGAVAPGELPV